jgi:hypothetical protein
MAMAMRRRWARRDRADEPVAADAAAPTVGDRAAVAAGSGLLTVARLVRLVASAVVLLIVAGILLVVLGANPANDIVSTVNDGASTLVGPFSDMFNLKSHKAEVALNWGIAAIVYSIAGGIVARFIARAAAAPLARAA